jgi:hypothetical protein
MGVIVLGLVAGVVAAFAIFPAVLYRHGAEARASGMKEVGWDSFNRLASWLQSPRPPDWTENAFVLAGLGGTILLSLLRHRFLWWPLHPAGYALGSGFAVDDYWFTMVLTSAMKWGVLRHSGARGYRASLPFFFGLILGDYIVACGWALVGVILNRPMYTVWI